MHLLCNYFAGFFRSFVLTSFDATPTIFPHANVQPFMSFAISMIRDSGCFTTANSLNNNKLIFSPNSRRGFKLSTVDQNTLVIALFMFLKIGVN